MTKGNGAKGDKSLEVILKEKKRRRNWAIVLLIIQLFALFAPLFMSVADASATEVDTEETSDETSEEEITKNVRGGNVYSDDNVLATGAFESTSKYDAYVHYLVTYNTLMSKMGDSAKGTPYAEVYVGKDGGANSQKGSVIGKKYGKKNTNSLSIIGDIENSATGDVVTGDAINESPTEGMSETEVAEEIDKLSTQLSEAMANNVLSVLQQNLTLNVDAGSIDYHGRDDSFFGDHQYKVGNSDAGRLGSGFIRLSTVKTSLGSGGSTPDIYKKALKEGFKSSISSGGSLSSLSKLSDSFSASSDLGKVIKEAEQAYDTSYMKKGVGTSTTGLYQAPALLGDGTGQWSIGGTWTSYGKTLNSWGDAPSKVHYLIRPENQTASKEEGRKIVEGVGIEYVKNRYLFNYTALPVDRSGIGKQLNDAYNKALSDNADAVKRLNAIVDANTIKAKDDVRTVAWTPIYPEIVAEKSVYDKLKELIEGVDEEASVSDKEFTLAGQPRTLQGMDAFLDVAKPSPVLIGGGVRADLTQISKLHLGSTSGSVTSGEEDTSKFVWYFANNSGKPKAENESTYRKQQKGNYLFGLYTSATEEYSGSFLTGTVAKEATLGADNYGNVINGETGEVIVPYWQNHMFSSKLDDVYFPYSPMIKSYGDIYQELHTSLADGKNPDKVFSVSGMASDEQIAKFVGSKNGIYKDAVEIRKMLEGNQSLENTMKVLKSGYKTMNQQDAMRALAVVISASTQDAVKSWNSAMLKDAKAGEELYISFEPLMKDRGYAEEITKERWSAASLIQKMGWIMDYGFADVIRLTIVSNLTRTYNTTIAESGLEYIFYTDTVTNSEEFESLSVLIATVIGAVISGYILLVGFKAFRGDIQWSKVVFKVMVLGGVLLYPMVVYGNLVEYTINKPTETIMSNQMRLSVVLDTYFAEENVSRNVNEFYKNMFGNYADSDALQLGSYNVKFYTTTDRAGFDINKTNPQDASLNVMQRNRLEEYQNGQKEYPKSQLISVDVPLVDLYKWVWDVRYSGKGMDDEKYGRDSKMPTYEDVVQAGTVEPLFQWLAKGGSSYFGVEGYDESALASYEEYKIMPDIVKPFEDNSIATEMAKSTYGAGVKAFGVEHEDVDITDNITLEKNVETTFGLQVLSASELFYEIVYNASTNSEVDSNLGALEDISYLTMSPEQPNSNQYVPTDEDIRALIRDLSITKEGRKMWYGSSNGWSNFTRATLTGNQGTNGVFIDEDGEQKQLFTNPKIDPPEEDFLGLTHIVNKYTPNRGEVNPYKRDTLEEDVSDINSKLLNNYLSTYSITKLSLGADADRNETALDHAEKMVMSTEAFFQFNDALGWDVFPQAYAVDSIKFDKYMALVFIPFKDYGKETMTFFDDSTVVPMSTAEYIAMTSSVWEYGLFMIAVVALVIFGLFYLAILYVGLLVYSMYNFMKFYVIKSDFQNKSALGSMMILLTLSFSKLVLMIVIWLSSWIMNKSVALSALNLPSYPTTLVHSIALLASVILVFTKIIKPVWKGIMSDKDNMGGQFFSDKASDVGKKLVSGGFLPGRGKGLSGGSQASKFNKGNSRANDGMKNNAGRLGSLTEKGLSKARNMAGKLGTGAVGYGLGKISNNNTVKRVNKVKDALERGQDKVKGITRQGRKRIDPTKTKASNLVERAQLGTLGRKMNTAVQTTSGLANTAVKVAQVGQELQNFQTGVITTMTLGSAGAATIVAQNLIDKGLKARTDGSKVLFDSSGYNLQDASVRSELFNNSVADLQDQNILKHANVDKGKVDGSTAINYNYNKGDSKINMALDAKTGVHPETFNQLMDTKEFKEMFIKPRANELEYDRMGNIVGLPVGGLRLVDPQMSASQVQNNMNNLYKVDNKLREENNLNQRKENNMDAVKIDGMDENYYTDNIASIVKDQKGMYTQGSRIVYNKMNPLHNKAMSQINQKVNEYNEQNEQQFGQESNNLMRYVVKDGDNQGVITNTVNGDENKVLASMVYGTDNFKQNVTKYKVNEGDMGQITENVSAVNSLRNLALGGDKKVAQTVHEFTDAKRDMRNLLSNEVKQMNANDNVTYNREMMDYLEETTVRNMPEFKTVKSNLQTIQNQYKQQEISQEQYHDLMRRENQNLMTIMDSEGKLDGFILKRYDDKSNNPFIQKYEQETKIKAEKEKKVYKPLKERYNESVDKLDTKVGRKKLMEMPLGIVNASTKKGGEEYQVDGKGVLVQKSDIRRKRNTLDGKDKDSVMSYLMKRPLEIKNINKRKVANQ